MSLSKRQIVAGLLLSVSLASIDGCRSAPVTGRKQLVLLPETQEIALGATAFQEVSTKEPLSTNAYYNEIVNRVGKRIAAVADRPDYQWEFRVIASPQQNAFCLPGGKVAVYEGILPICQTEAGLAVVMSHEIGHAIARHGGERMSQGYVVEGGRQAVAWATGKYAEHQKEMILKVYGAGSQYGVILPYSRKHESEADHIGMMLLAKAGYDPEEAPRFWQRFAGSHEGTQPVEFLSTHPSDERRAADLAALLPQARQLYEAAPVKFGIGETLQVTPLAANTSPGGPSPESLRSVSTPFSGPSINGGQPAAQMPTPAAMPTMPLPTGIPTSTGESQDHLNWQPPPIRP